MRSTAENRSVRNSMRIAMSLLAAGAVISVLGVWKLVEVVAWLVSGTN